MELTPAALMAWALKTRRLARAPIWLFRHGLGGAVGSRLMMLEHVGRNSVCCGTGSLPEDASAGLQAAAATIEQATGAPVANLPMVELELSEFLPGV